MSKYWRPVIHFIDLGVTTRAVGGKFGKMTNGYEGHPNGCRYRLDMFCKKLAVEKILEAGHTFDPSRRQPRGGRR